MGNTYFDGSRSRGESNQSPSSFISDCSTSGVEQVVDASDEPRTLIWVSVANLNNNEINYHSYVIQLLTLYTNSTITNWRISLNSLTWSMQDVR